MRQTHMNTRRQDLRQAVVRGLGIFLVVFGHNAELSPLLLGMGTSFLMPMFFLLSGIAFHYSGSQCTGRELVRHLFVTLVFPFFFFAIVSIPFYELPVLNGGCQWPTFQFAAWSLLCGQFFSDGSLWFLMSLCLCKLLFWAILRVQRWMKSGILIWCAVALACIALQMKFAYRPAWENLFIPLALPTLPSGLLFFAIGYALTPCYNWLRRIKLHGSESMAVSLVCLYVIYKFMTPGQAFGMHVGDLKSMGIYATAIAGSVMLFMFANILQSRRLHFLRITFAWIGRNSLILFAIEDGVVGYLARECSFSLIGVRRGWFATAIAFALLPLAYKAITPSYEWLKERALRLICPRLRTAVAASTLCKGPINASEG